MGYRLDDVKGISVIGLREEERVETYRLQGNLELDLSQNILFNMGVMFEDNGLNGLEISPRLGVNYKVAPGHFLRFLSPLVVASHLLQKHFMMHPLGLMMVVY
ncbi:MAG: hypothetical protein R3E73_01170 [Porticoccaceae bacterium]